MITAYREPDRSRGRELMSKLIESVPSGSATSPTSPPDPYSKRAASDPN